MKLLSIFHLMVAVGLAAALTACGDGASVPPSPGAMLVRNATASGLPTVAEFGANTCASCREMKIVLDKVAHSTVGHAHVVIIDIGRDHMAGQTYRIQLMPTQVFFDAYGRETSRHMGKLTEAEVVARLGLSPP